MVRRKTDRSPETKSTRWVGQPVNRVAPTSSSIFTPLDRATHGPYDDRVTCPLHTGLVDGPRTDTVGMVRLSRWGVHVHFRPTVDTLGIRLLQIL